MEVSVIVSVVGALAGVVLGGALAARGQARMWSREELRRWSSERRATYGRFVTTARQFRGYLAGTDVNIGVVRAPDGVGLVPHFEPFGTEHRQRLDAAFIDVQLIGTDAAVVAAEAVYRISFRVAVARGIHGRIIPDWVGERFSAAERAFVNTVRQELGLRPLTDPPYQPTSALQELDSMLRQDFEALAADPA